MIPKPFCARRPRRAAPTRCKSTHVARVRLDVDAFDRVIECNIFERNVSDAVDLPRAQPKSKPTPPAASARSCNHLRVRRDRAHTRADAQMNQYVVHQHILSTRAVHAATVHRLHADAARARSYQLTDCTPSTKPSGTPVIEICDLAVSDRNCAPNHPTSQTGHRATKLPLPPPLPTVPSGHVNPIRVEWKRGERVGFEGAIRTQMRACTVQHCNRANAGHT